MFIHAVYTFILFIIMVDFFSIRLWSQIPDFKCIYQIKWLGKVSAWGTNLKPANIIIPTQ